jgi:PAS domain S-box-containing protein
VIRLLHVDDDRTILELSGIFLGRGGDIIADCVLSGETAAEMLKSQKYDAIVSDYQMPGWSGIDLLKHVRQNDQVTPFLFFSDQKDEDIVIEALTCGADFFLPKGHQVRSQFIQLEHAIRETVKRRRAEEQHERISSLLRIREAAFRSSHCPLALCDTEGRIQYANPAGLAIWGYTDEQEVIGRSAVDFVVSPEITGNDIQELFTERAWSGCAVARRRDGTTFDARVSVNVVDGDSGRPLGFVAAFSDISRQNRAREQLESISRDIRFVTESAAAMMDFTRGADIYGFIADSLSHLAPRGSVIVLSSVLRDSVVRLEAVRGEESAVASIERAFGMPLEGLSLHPPAGGLGPAIPQSFVQVEGGIDTITFGLLPREVCRKIQELPFFEKVIGRGLWWEGKLHGVTAILLPPGSMPKNTDILDLFILHCSAVLQRREAEHLIGNRDMDQIRYQ